MPRYLLTSAALGAALLLGLAPGATAQGNCQPGVASATLDANQVSARLYNNGNLFFNGGDGQYEVPKGSGLISIFAAGIWAGGTVDGELRTAAATYAQGTDTYEFWPGPLTDGAPPADCAAFDRIYLVSQADIDAYDAGGAATPDLAEWPADLGAPVADGDGDPDNYDLAAGDRPELQGAAQSAWWVMNDVGNDHGSTQTPPIGLEVRVQALSYTADDDETPDFVETATFYEYTFVYQGDDTLEEFYTTLWLDADVGNFNDDYVGSVPELGLGYAYNADDDDDGGTGYGVDPPAVGVLGLFAEVGDVPEARAPFFARGGQRSVTSSVMYYNNDTTAQGNPSGGQNYYDLQRARWRDGTRLLFGADGYYQSGGTASATPYAFSGAPPDFWSEYDALPAAGAQPNAPADRRFLQSFGPYTLESGEALVLGTGILWAREAGGGAIGSRDALLEQANVLFDGGSFEPEPVFGNSLAPLTVTVPQNQTATLAFAVDNPGGAALEFSLAPGTSPGSAFLDLGPGDTVLEPGAVADASVDVDPQGAAVGVYDAEILVTSNDRNVVSATIPVTVTVTMAVAGEEGAAGRFALAAPRPNPAAGTSRLEYEISEAGPVRLSVIDVLGREVAVAVDGTRTAGAHVADLMLDALPSGLYVVRLQAGGQEATQRLTVVR